MPQTITFGSDDLDAAPPPPATPGERFVQGAWQNLNPMGLVQAAAHPLDTLGHVIDAHLTQLQKAKQLYEDGRYTEAAGHLGAAALPVLGPAAAQAGEAIASGDIAGGLGQATGLLASVEAPRAAGAATRAVAAPLARAAAALPGAGSNLVGVVSPRLAYGLAVAKDIRDAVRGAGAAESATLGEGADLAARHAAERAAFESGQAPTLGPIGRMLTKEEYSALKTAQAAARARAVRPGAAPAPVSAPDTAPSPAAPLTPLADLAAPGASPPAAPAPPAALTPPESAPRSPAPMASPTASPWSPQRIANEVGLAARRAKLKLTDAQYAAAEDLVRQGQTPAQAVTTAAPPKLKVTAAEMGLYSSLRRRGLSDTAIRAAIQAQRDLAAKLGTPTADAVRQAVQERNLTGDWPDQ